MKIKLREKSFMAAKLSAATRLPREQLTLALALVRNGAPGLSLES